MIDRWSDWFFDSKRARVAHVSLFYISRTTRRRPRRRRRGLSSPYCAFSARFFFLLFVVVIYPYIYTFKSILKRSRRPTKRRKHTERRLLLLHPLSSFATPLSLSLIEFRFSHPLSPLVLFFECDAYYYFFLLNPAAVFLSGPKNKIFLDEVFPIKANTRDTHARARRQIRRTHTERESSDELFLLLFFWRAHTQRDNPSLARDWERAIKRRRNLSF